MYGLLLANMQEYVEKTFGQKAWEEVREALKIKVRIMVELKRIVSIWYTVHWHDFGPPFRQSYVYFMALNGV